MYGLCEEAGEARTKCLHPKRTAKMPVPQDFRRGQEMQTSAGGQWSAGNEESILMNRKGAAKAGPVPTSTSTHFPPR